MPASAVLSSTLLKKVAKPPNVLANVLDWKMTSGSLATAMAIDIHADRIGLALATLTENSGPGKPNNATRRRSANRSRACFDCKELDSIPIITVVNNDSLYNSSNNNTQKRRRGKRRKRVVSPEGKDWLLGLVREHNVSGFVVSWQIQHDTGLMGASCGRTLWTLEQLMAENDEYDDDYNSNSIFTPTRPFCLWDGVHTNKEQPPTDSFGRCSVYARTSDKTEYRASKEQYHHDKGVIPSQILTDFCRSHWPDIVNGNGDHRKETLADTPVNTLIESRYYTRHSTSETFVSSIARRLTTNRSTLIMG